MGVCVCSVVVGAGVGIDREVGDVGELSVVLEEGCESLGVIGGGSEWGWGGVREWRALGGVGAFTAVGGVSGSHWIGVVWRGLAVMVVIV